MVDPQVARQEKCEERREIASATRADGDVAFAKPGENLEPAATAAVEARTPRQRGGKAGARGGPLRLLGARALHRALDVAVLGASRRRGRAVSRWPRRRSGRRDARGAGGVGGASTATGAGIAAGGRLADQGADGAICWRSIDGWLPPDAADRLGCSIDGWLLCGPITDAAPGEAARFVVDQCCVRAVLNQCVAPASRGQPWRFMAREQPATFGLDRPRPPAAVQKPPAAPRARLGRTSFQTIIRSGELLTRSCLSYRRPAGNECPINRGGCPHAPRREAEGLWAA